MNEGEILGLIGPNGAGKTTLFNIISGVQKSSRGEVIFKGEDIRELKPHAIARRGVVRTYQTTTLYSHLSVLANLLIGFHLKANIGFFETVFNTLTNQKKEKNITQHALKLLDFLALRELKDELAINLPHGYQRTLGIGVALAAEPELLLLDEPMSGMSQSETSLMMENIARIQKEMRVTVVLIEHDMRAVMGLCHRIAVLNYGTKIADGPPEEIKRNDEVIKAYLGEDDEYIA